MAIYTTKAKSEEFTNPEVGDKGYNSRGQAVWWTGSNWSISNPTPPKVTNYADTEAGKQKTEDAKDWATNVMGIDPEEYGSEANLRLTYNRYLKTQEGQQDPEWNEEGYYRSIANQFGLPPDDWRIARDRMNTLTDFDPANDWHPGTDNVWYQPGGSLTTEPPDYNNAAIPGRQPQNPQDPIVPGGGTPIQPPGYQNPGTGDGGPFDNLAPEFQYPVGQPWGQGGNPWDTWLQGAYGSAPNSQIGMENPHPQQQNNGSVRGLADIIARKNWS